MKLGVLTTSRKRGRRAFTWAQGTIIIISSSSSSSRIKNMNVNNFIPITIYH